MDWTSMYFEAPQNKFVRVGHSRDHRPDRPQVTVGLTIMPGNNVVDVVHFRETFAQLRPLLPDDAMIVFDNGAYSRENSALLDREGFGFVTRLQMNASDDALVKSHSKEFIALDGLGEGMSYLPIQDNLKAAVEENRRPRKKYRSSNCFVDTRLSYRFPLDDLTREEAIKQAIASMATSREGLSCS